MRKANQSISIERKQMSTQTNEDLEKRVGKLEKLESELAETRNALRESERKYKTLTANITVGIFRSTPGSRGKFIEVNNAFVRMLGYQNESELFVGDVAQYYKNPEDRARFSEKISQKGFVHNEELILKKKDGSTIHAIETAVAVRDENQQVQYFVGIIEDITEQKKSEEELHIQKTYLERLFNSAPEAIVLHDNNDLVVNVNSEFTKLFGYSYEEAAGKPVNELVAPLELLDEAAGLSLKVTHGDRVAVETKRKRKDGKLIDVSILGAPIMDGKKQMGVYAIYRDITQRKKAEEELRIQKAYLERLFNSAPEAIALHDNGDFVVDINQEFTRMFGYSREEAIGKPINDLVVSEEYLEEACGLSQMSLRGERVEIDSKRKCKDGTLIDVSILGAPIIYGDKQMAVYAIYRDITERKRAEETRLRLREEARMAKNIQLNFLPKSNPEINGYDIAGKSIPALNVGGDYYDFIYLEEDRIAIGLGDVCGKGLAASLVMANLQATIRGLAMFNEDPEKCLEKANKLLYRSTDSRTFISLFYGILDFKNNTLCFANAGQNPPILFSRGGKPVLLKTRGIALGIMESATYEREIMSVEPEDLISFYSDGITEAVNEKMEEFGDKNLLRIIQSNRDMSSYNLIEKIISSVNKHIGSMAQSDDMTMILVKRRK